MATDMANIRNAFYHLKFVRKKPRILLRIAKDYLYVRVLRKSRLRTVDYAITYRCNSNCRMCSAKRLMYTKTNRGKREMTPEEIVAVWKQAVRLGAIHMNLTGGEPTLRSEEEILKILGGVNSVSALSSLVTNCLSLKKDELKRYVDAGLDTISISLDSIDEKTHDMIRGVPGNYRRFMQVLEWSREFGLNICISSVITAKNFRDIRKIIEFGRKKGVFVLLNLISPTGANVGNDTLSIRLKEKEFRELLEIPHVRTDFIFNFRGGSGCPAGVEKVYITPYGEVMTCPHVQISYGNVMVEPLERIYRRISGFPLLKNFDKRGCRYTFDMEYLERMLKPVFGIRDLPVSIFDHPIAKDMDIREYLKKHPVIPKGEEG